MSDVTPAQAKVFDETVCRVLLGEAECGDSESLCCMIDDSEELRQRFLDHVAIQSFLVDEGRAGGFSENPKRLFEALEETETLPKVTQLLSRGLSRWISAVAAVVVIGLILVFTVQLPNRVNAASQSLDQIIAAFGRMDDRAYVIHVINQHSSKSKSPHRGSQKRGGAGRYPPPVYLDKAQLFLRGGRQFVLKQELPNGEHRIMGGDGEISWSFRGDGPVRMSHDPQRFRGGLPGRQQDLAFLDLRTQLSNLKDLYQIEIIKSNSQTEVGLQGLRGYRNSREQGGPKIIEIWFDPSNGMIHRMVLEGLPRRNEHPGALKLELVSSESLPTDFFSHNAHHEPGRRIEADKK
ncbi:hypothetical protein HW115_15065 [Verrucomicrobiaceae bacterium N1E253]|uniref:Uncharacterized protein n=1 Tax=Oceaniferula marina TaxID=2748318 RepID=A0A851GIZ3_9BACT|nr:hypothetical protein [Oceaniferula marina]NWK56942.1 hypothetical protein [Oceaniferula marina]